MYHVDISAMLVVIPLCWRWSYHCLVIKCLVKYESMRYLNFICKYSVSGILHFLYRRAILHRDVHIVRILSCFGVVWYGSILLQSITLVPVNYFWLIWIIVSHELTITADIAITILCPCRMGCIICVIHTARTINTLKWKNNFIPLVIGHVVTYRCWD